MSARLFCKTGELAGAEYRISDEATIGRNSQNDITLHPNIVSGRHARIYYDEQEEAFFVEDLGSRNGTQVDGVEVEEPIRLEPLSVITFANKFDFIFQTAQEEEPERSRSQPERRTQAAQGGASGEGKKTRVGDAFAPMPDIPEEEEEEEAAGEKTRVGDAFTPMPDIPEEEEEEEAAGEKTRVGDAFTPMPDIPEEEEKTNKGDETVFAQPSARAKPTYTLEVTHAGGDQDTYTLDEGEHVIGRLSDSDIPLDDNAVSRRHAMLTVRKGRVMLKDLGSKNFTFLNGDRISSEVEVKPGATLRFGPHVEAALHQREQ